MHNVRGLCSYTLWDLLVIGICAIVVPSAKPKRQTDARSLRNVSLLGIFLLFCLQVPGFALFTFRGLLLCDTLTQRQPAAHERQEAVRFRRIAPYGAWNRQPERPHVQPPVPRKGLRIFAKV
nr:MAG TPA: hypothetical protein [Caudoviricetes sp.]